MIMKLIFGIFKWWWRRSWPVRIGIVAGALVAASVREVQIGAMIAGGLLVVVLATRVLFATGSLDRAAGKFPIVGRRLRLRQVARGAGLTRSDDGRESMPRVRSKRTTTGHQLTVTPVAGTGVESYERIQDQLRSAYGAERVRVTRDERQRAVIDIMDHDLLALPREISDLPSIPAVQDLDHVQVGWTETGEPWTVSVAAGSLIVGGVPDAGKSSLVSSLLGAIAWREDVQLVGVDLKDMVELAEWSPRFAETAGDQDQLLDVLLCLESVRSRRMRQLREKGVTSARRHGFSETFPLILVVVDEAAEAFNATGSAPQDKKRAARIVSLTSRLIRLGRAAGIFLLLATQKPTADAIPTQIRDAAATKISLRVVNDESARAILGDTRADGDADPVDISRDRQGVAVADTGHGYRYVRSYFVGEQMRREIAAATRPLRKSLDSLVPQAEEAEA